MPLTIHLRRAVLAVAALAPGSAGWAACTVTATPMAFGEYRPTATQPTASAGSITLVCSQLLTLMPTYKISLSAGGGSFADRRMTSGGSQLRYQIYRDATYRQVWGDGTAGTTALSDTQLLNLLAMGKSYPVYGLIPARQNVPPGVYGDTILVTVTY
ncbi:spore coat U domain-containing protein [Pseudoroseomonas globiformis]|uniref:Spore coat U domain-containing protein n=1 Tax=Teichococcus globiformis TaxID=2307229 RepID=A0ABV7FXF2_9PROT